MGWQRWEITTKEKEGFFLPFASRRESALCLLRAICIFEIKHDKLCHTVYNSLSVIDQSKLLLSRVVVRL